ncbi:MAG: hypothetical protein OIF38_14690, partial [Cellvibrionaceae bacterium]|nr:hypothetical protein [Cellvibrionaceae bacterium]
GVPVWHTQAAAGGRNQAALDIINTELQTLADQLTQSRSKLRALESSADQQGLPWTPGRSL